MKDRDWFSIDLMTFMIPCLALAEIRRLEAGSLLCHWGPLGAKLDLSQKWHYNGQSGFHMKEKTRFSTVGAIQFTPKVLIVEISSILLCWFCKPPIWPICQNQKCSSMGGLDVLGLLKTTLILEFKLEGSILLLFNCLKAQKKDLILLHPLNVLKAWISYCFGINSSIEPQNSLYLDQFWSFGAEIFIGFGAKVWHNYLAHFERNIPKFGNVSILQNESSDFMPT